MATSQDSAPDVRLEILIGRGLDVLIFFSNENQYTPGKYTGTGFFGV